MHKSLNDTLTPQLSLFMLQLSPAPEEANPDPVDAPLAQESPPGELFSCYSSRVFEKWKSPDCLKTLEKRYFIQYMSCSVSFPIVLISGG